MKETETKTQNKPESKGKRVFKTIINTIINILIVVVLITSLLIAVLALTSKSSGISTIFGYTIQPIQSDSMKGGSPDGYGGKDFEKGDLMIAKATNKDESAVYEKGDIITFITKDSDGTPMLISHRIVDVKQNGVGETLYQTQGDNREMAQVPDQDENNYILASDIASVYYTSDYEGTIIKGFGAFIDYLQSQQGFFFVVLLPMIIFFMYALVRVVLSATGYKKSKAEEDKDEAVKAAVAEALAAKGITDGEAIAENADEKPADETVKMTAEELEQFKQFQEFQKMQKAQQEAAENKPDSPTE